MQKLNVFICCVSLFLKYKLQCYKHSLYPIHILILLIDNDMLIHYILTIGPLACRFVFCIVLVFTVLPLNQIALTATLRSPFLLLPTDMIAGNI